jgi:ubiquinone/menaquinone biosynthesis C-methylase UbiE
MALDSAAWLARWEAMQDAYVPFRAARFALMLDLAELPPGPVASVLDLGCGPGSLSLRVARGYPQAEILAVDAEEALLSLGCAAAASCGSPIRFLQADLREGGWWAERDGQFDLVISATALHWLNAEHLTQTYRRIFRALKPGGCFLNSDHYASDHAETQAHYRALLRSWQQTAFGASGAEDWHGFWRGLTAELAREGKAVSLAEDSTWEGSDNGLSRSFHLQTLQDCGFARVEFHWQWLGEAILGASRPE